MLLHTKCKKKLVKLAKNDPSNIKAFLIRLKTFYLHVNSQLKASPKLHTRKPGGSLKNLRLT